MQTEEVKGSTKMKDYQDYLPRTQAVNVAGKDLVVREYNAAKRDAFVKVVLSNLHVATLIKPLAETWRRRSADKAADGMNYEDLAEQIKTVALKLLSNDLTLVVCLTLDVPENRKALGAGENLQQHPEHGFLHSPEVFKWVRENLLPRNEPALVKAVIEVNDFMGLVKNWAALVGEMMSAAREEKTKTD